MGNDYQSQIDATIGTDDGGEEILSLSAEDKAEALDSLKAEPTEPTVEPEALPVVEEIEAQVESELEDRVDPETGQTYTKDQVQTIVRTRVAKYEQRLSKMNEYKSAVDKIAEVSGLSEEQLISRLNTMSDAEQANLLGVTPEQVAGMRLAKTTQLNNAQEIKKLNRELEMTQLKSDKKYSDIDLFMDDILFKVEDHPSLSLKDAYTLVKGELGFTAQIRDAEQRAINSQAAAKGKAPANPVGAAQTPPKKMSAEVISAASLVDMDPNEYVAFQNIDNIDAYRAWKKQKGK